MINKTILSVDGIHCSACVRSITKNIEQLSGIHSINVDLKKNQVAIEYEPQKVSINEIILSVEEAGYDVVKE